MKKLKDLINDFNSVSKNYVFHENQLPRIIGNISVKVMHQNFDSQGFKTSSSGSVIKWRKRKPSTNKAYDRRTGNNKGSKNHGNNPILRQSGDLYNSIHYVTTKNKVFVGCNLKIFPYAKIHNEGGQGLAFGKYPFKMRKRKFIGVSPYLFFILGSEIQYNREKIFKKFTK